MVAAKGKAVTAKLAATGAASLLGAAALAGALALPAGFGTVPAGDSVRHGSQFGAASVASSPVAPGLDAQQGQAVSFPGASPGAGQAPTPVPEPSSLALLGGFATLVLAASVLRDAVWKDVSSPVLRVIPARLEIDSRARKKAFFFGKKKQKTFDPAVADLSTAADREKKFFASFFQKRRLSLLA